MPRHTVNVASFAIGRYPVTNAEWACFVEAGGYEDERWWTTDDARAWRRGERTADGRRAVWRYWWRHFKEHPDEAESYFKRGQWDNATYERWKRRLGMSEDEFERHLADLYPAGRLTEPRYWQDEIYRNPLLPVVGVTWFEARAYCAWLSALTGDPFRLPTEAEWEVAARGPVGRRCAYGDEPDPTKGNHLETHMRQPTPVGVFVEGDSPEGVSDLTGNVWEWTSSLFGCVEDDRPLFPYPYDAGDGREDPTAAADIQRVSRGASWYVDLTFAKCALRVPRRPDHWDSNLGVRLVTDG